MAENKPSIKKFVVKNIIKIVIFITMSIVVSTLIQSPVITNEIALGQMENSNEAFMLMEAYNKFKPFIEWIYLLIMALFIGSIVYDTYKFIKTKLN